MNVEQIREREAIAQAASFLAGKKFPLSATTPEDERTYLFATPESEGKFNVPELVSRLERHNDSFGVNWDRSDARFGLRFLSADMPVPRELHPFTTAEAKAEWMAWRAKEKKMGRHLVAAAKVAADKGGEAIEFREQSNGRSRSGDPGRDFT